MIIRFMMSALAALGLMLTLAMAPINSTCPMSGQPVASDITTTMHGSEIGFCCNGCKARFAKLDHGAQHEKVDTVMAKQAVPAGQPPRTREMLTLNIAYLLPTCPVSGKLLSSMESPVTKDPGQLFTRAQIEEMSPELRGAAARSVTFCCDGCVGTYQANPAQYIDKVNSEITSRQLPSYPLEVCLASGRPLDVKGTPVDRVFMNQLMRFCCKGCANVVLKFDPANPGADGARWLSAQKKLEKAYVNQQLPTYPLTTCVISGRPLAEKTINLVEGHTLVRICCPGCEKSFNADPVKYIDVVESARKQDAEAAS